MMPEALHPLLLSGKGRALLFVLLGLLAAALRKDLGGLKEVEATSQSLYFPAGGGRWGRGGQPAAAGGGASG